MTGTQIEFGLEVRDYLLVVFFATIGLNAQIADLFRGGRLLVLFLALTFRFHDIVKRSWLGCDALWLTRCYACFSGFRFTNRRPRHRNYLGATN
nr:sodium/glutamate symporter [Epibacterium ulvae]